MLVRFSVYKIKMHNMYPVYSRHKIGAALGIVAYIAIYKCRDFELSKIVARTLGFLSDLSYFCNTLLRLQGPYLNLRI